MIIAADQSQSMFDSKNITIQTEALITALSNYVIDCNQIQIDYLAWGDTINNSLSIKLTDEKSLQKFAVDLNRVSYNQLQGTSHGVAIRNSVIMFNKSKAVVKVLIFITDGVSTNKTDWSLGHLIPNDVVVYAIALGLGNVSDFVKLNILPADQGEHFYYAKNSDDLAAVIERALADAKTELCVS